MLFFTWYFLHTQNKLVLCAVHAGCVQQLKSVVALSPLPSLGCFQFEVARNCFIVISVCCHFSEEKKTKKKIPCRHQPRTTSRSGWTTCGEAAAAVAVTRKNVEYINVERKLVETKWSNYQMVEWQNGRISFLSNFTLYKAKQSAKTKVKLRFNLGLT